MLIKDHGKTIEQYRHSGGTADDWISKNQARQDQITASTIPIKADKLNKK